MNYPELILIMEALEELIPEDAKVEGTVYENATEVLDDIDAYIGEFMENSGTWIQYLDVHFDEDQTYHLIAQQNGWDDQYKELLERYFIATGVK